MRPLLIFTMVCALFCGHDTIHAQTEDVLSRDLAVGLAELRKDIFTRKSKYAKNINQIITRLDSSSIADTQKKAIYTFIQKDVKDGGLSNSIEMYDLIPDNHPFRNQFIEEYIINNQDYQIDKDLIAELTKSALLTPKGRIYQPKVEELKKDFGFLEIKADDRLLLFNAWGGNYALLLGYTFEGIDLTIHNQFLDDHYLAQDRLDRYPNVNNGNLIEFLNDIDPRLMYQGEQWNKIIIRQTDFIQRSGGYIIKSFHNNLTTDGHLYLLHEVASGDTDCKGKLKESSIIKKMLKSDFELINKLESGCQTYFKFKSIKE